MNLLRNPFATSCLFICSLFLVTGCTTVMSSRSLDLSEDKETCHSQFGSYALPRTLLRAQVLQSQATMANSLLLTSVTVPDNRHHYCLDYLSSSAADDKVAIVRDSDEMLMSISSKIVDQSALIIRKIIRAIFVAVSNNANFGPVRSDTIATSVSLAEIEYDPFDPVESALVNSRLSQLGFCLILEDYTFDRSSSSAINYCTDPQGTHASSPSKTAALVSDQGPLVPERAPGVKYRPTMNYSMEIWRRPDTEGPEPWQLAKMQQIPLENVSPIISVEVSRAVFAERRTAMTFDHGVLTTFCLAKGSEAEGAISIPIDIVYGIVQLPAQTIQAELARISGQDSLIKAQTEVINAQRNLIELNRQSLKTAYDPFPKADGLKDFADQASFIAPKVVPGRDPSFCQDMLGTK